MNWLIYQHVSKNNFLRFYCLHAPYHLSLHTLNSSINKQYVSKIIHHYIRPATLNDLCAEKSNIRNIVCTEMYCIMIFIYVKKCTNRCSKITEKILITFITKHKILRRRLSSTEMEKNIKLHLIYDI